MAPHRLAVALCLLVAACGTVAQPLAAPALTEGLKAAASKLPEAVSSLTKDIKKPEPAGLPNPDDLIAKLNAGDDLSDAELSSLLQYVTEAERDPASIPLPADIESQIGGIDIDSMISRLATSQELTEQDLADLTRLAGVEDDLAGLIGAVAPAGLKKEDKKEEKLPLSLPVAAAATGILKKDDKMVETKVPLPPPVAAAAAEVLKQGDKMSMPALDPLVAAALVAIKPDALEDEKALAAKLAGKAPTSDAEIVRAAAAGGNKIAEKLSAATEPITAIIPHTITSSPWRVVEGDEALITKLGAAAALSSRDATLVPKSMIETEDGDLKVELDVPLLAQVALMGPSDDAQLQDKVFSDFASSPDFSGDLTELMAKAAADTSFDAPRQEVLAKLATVQAARAAALKAKVASSKSTRDALMARKASVIKAAKAAFIAKKITLVKTISSAVAKRNMAIRTAHAAAIAHIISTMKAVIKAKALLAKAVVDKALIDLLPAPLAKAYPLRDEALPFLLQGVLKGIDTPDLLSLVGRLAPSTLNNLKDLLDAAQAVAVVSTGSADAELGLVGLASSMGMPHNIDIGKSLFHLSHMIRTAVQALTDNAFQTPAEVGLPSLIPEPLLINLAYLETHVQY